MQYGKPKKEKKKEDATGLDDPATDASDTIIAGGARRRDHHPEDNIIRREEAKCEGGANTRPRAATWRRCKWKKIHLNWIRQQEAPRTGSSGAEEAGEATTPRTRTSGEQGSKLKEGRQEDTEQQQVEGGT